MFREVTLPDTTPGRLFLHSMPARYESWGEFKTWIEAAKVGRMVCLAEQDEIRRKSPDYFGAIRSNRMPCTRIDFPTPDYQVSSERGPFADCVKLVAGYISAGETVLIHCAGGIGRTGTFATCILQEFGLDSPSAGARVSEAGSAAETQEQRDLVRWHANEHGLIPG